MTFIKLTNKEFKALRKKQWLNQNKRCPILNQVIHYSEAVFDHKHKTKKEPIGVDGKGLLRGVIHNQANIMEGKITNTYKRYGLNKFIPLPELLRRIADYLEDPPMKQKYIHPKELPKKERLKKSDFNKICKYYFEIYPKSKILPKYLKNQKMTKRFQLLLQKACELHERHLNEKAKKKK